MSSAGERSTSVPAGFSTEISTPVPNAGATAVTLTALPHTPGEAAVACRPRGAAELPGRGDGAGAGGARDVQGAAALGEK